jgi:hypothetical protein
MDLDLQIEFCIMAWFGFESLKDLGFMVLGKLLEDYGFGFRFYEDFDV